MLVLPASSNRLSADESQYMDILNSHTTAWPGLCCWWCTNPIPADKQPIPMIHQIVRSAWAIPNIHRQAGFNLHKHGFFCCAGCVKAFCVSRSISFSPTRMWIAGCHTPDGSRRTTEIRAWYISYADDPHETPYRGDNETHSILVCCGVSSMRETSCERQPQED
jgi:hypothetical protein